METTRATRIVLLFTFIVIVIVSARGIFAQGVGLPVEAAGYQRALYPTGLPARVNPMSDATEQPEFELDAQATLPNSSRHVIVYAERITKDLPSDRMYWVYVATLERRGDSFNVLDRQEVTEDLKLFTEFPGNFLFLRALVTPLVARTTTVAAIELSTTLSGTGGLTEGNHFFYAISPNGRMARILTLGSTSNSGRSGPQASATISTVKVGVASDVSGDIVLSTWSAAWNAFDQPASVRCEAAGTTYYRFRGSNYERADPVTVAATRFKELPRLFDSPRCVN